jgi:hypothetical protein
MYETTGCYVRGLEQRAVRLNNKINETLDIM